MSRIRFSIRTLLILTAIVAAAVYPVAIPSISARRYVNALSRGDFARAGRLCRPGESRFPIPDAEVDPADVLIDAKIEPLTIQNTLIGERHINLVFTYHGSLTYIATGVATRGGIMFVQIEP